MVTSRSQPSSDGFVQPSGAYFHMPSAGAKTVFGPPSYQMVQKPQLSAEERATNDRLASRGTTYLRSLFLLPDALAFSIEDVHDTRGGEPIRVVYFSHNGIDKIELPTPQEFRDRELNYPVGLRALLKDRGLLAEQLTEYEALAALSKDDRVGAARVLDRHSQSRKYGKADKPAALTSPTRASESKP